MEEAVLAEFKDVLVPDIGTPESVDVIEVLVKPGDTIAKDDSLITLESDKASMEIPSPFAGVIESLHVNVGDKIAQGGLILKLAAQDATEEAEPAAAPPAKSAPAQKAAPVEAPAAAATKPTPPPAPAATPSPTTQPSITPTQPSTGLVYAGPAVRRLAREWGITLTEVTGSGRKGRILKEDLQAFNKQRLSGAGGGCIRHSPTTQN